MGAADFFIHVGLARKNTTDQPCPYSRITFEHNFPLLPSTFNEPLEFYPSNSIRNDFSVYAVVCSSLGTTSMAVSVEI